MFVQGLLESVLTDSRAPWLRVILYGKAVPCHQDYASLENTAGVEGTVIWEANQMQRNGVVQILGGHCIGLERFVYLRAFLGSDDGGAVFSSVGAALSMTGGFSLTLPYAVGLPLHPGWETALQQQVCGNTPPMPSCQASVSVWNYNLVHNISPKATGMVIGNGSQLMTVQQYLASRAAAGM
jgi:hypothetical protein